MQIILEFKLMFRVNIPIHNHYEYVCTMEPPCNIITYTIYNITYILVVILSDILSSL